MIDYQLILPAAAAAGITAAALLALGRRGGLALKRLESLINAGKRAEPARTAPDPCRIFPLEYFGDRLGRAGAFEPSERTALLASMGLLTAGGLCLGGAAGFFAGATSPAQLFCSVAGINFGACAAVLLLRVRQRRYRQQTLFYLPLVMEQLILLIESGLGLMPALHLIAAGGRPPGQESNAAPAAPVVCKSNPILFVLKQVYQISAGGVPFSSAIEAVAAAVPSRPLRHVLLHLDIGAAEGGELIPALRGLSDHCHMEWRHSVESRIKRLENLVIFPVFGAVLGLMVLVAAVPLVPLIELRDRLQPRPMTDPILDPHSARFGSNAAAGTVR